MKTDIDETVKIRFLKTQSGIIGSLLRRSNLKKRANIRAETPSIPKTPMENQSYRRPPKVKASINVIMASIIAAAPK
jgi:hypothetical protein